MTDQQRGQQPAGTASNAPGRPDQAAQTFIAAGKFNVAVLESHAAEAGFRCKQRQSARAAR
jgi:hypothetical protein